MASTKHSPPSPAPSIRDLVYSASFALANCSAIALFMMSGLPLPGRVQPQEIASIGMVFSILLLYPVFRYQFFKKSPLRVRVACWTLTGMSAGFTATFLLLGMPGIHQYL
jgi:hypothetical protein